MGQYVPFIFLPYVLRIYTGLFDRKLFFSAAHNYIAVGDIQSVHLVFTLAGDHTGVVVCDPSVRAEEAKRTGAPSEFLFKIQTDEIEFILATDSASLSTWVKALRSHVGGFFLTHDFYMLGA